MRFWLAWALALCACPALGFSQDRGSLTGKSSSRHSSSVQSHHGHDGGHHHLYGPHPVPGYGSGSCYGPSFGFGYYNPYPFGHSYTSYSSITFGVPGFSVGYTAPLFGNTYYGPGYGYGWNTPVYTAPPIYLNPQQTPPALPQWMIDEANLYNNRLDRVKPLSQTHPSLIPPSTPEAQMRSVRLQDAGDRLFVNLDYSAAEKSYAKSVQAAPDRPEPYVRLAVAKAARGDFRGAVSFLKLMADVDATYPGRADSLDTLFSLQHGVSKVQLKQRVADWTKVDVRDPDRVFLLGIVLFLDGDDRFRTLLETALKLDGEQPYLRAFLDATPAKDAARPAPTPDEIDALPNSEPAGAQPLLLPPNLPEPPAP